MASHLFQGETVLSLTPEAVVCVLGDAFLLQSSEFVEDVEVGVIAIALLLLLPATVAKQIRTGSSSCVLSLPPSTYSLIIFTRACLCLSYILWLSFPGLNSLFFHSKGTGHLKQECHKRSEIVSCSLAI